MTGPFFNSLLNIPMADWFSRAFSGDSQFPLFLLHGNRSLTRPGISTSDHRLRLDITGLLTAFHLDLLDTVERRWAPIELPFFLPQTLNGMERQLRPIQPLELQAIELLVSNVEDHRIQGVDVEGVREGRGKEDQTCPLIVVEYTANLAGTTEVNPRRVLDVLTDLRAESPELLESAAREFGSLSTEEPLGPIPEPGQGLAFSANTVTLFARAGLLRALTATFSIFVDNRYLQIARAELTEHRRRSDIADQLRALANRITYGIQCGTYQVLPYLDPEMEEDGTQGGAEPLGAVGRCLVEAMSSPAQQETVVWTDDRMMNRFRNTEAMEIACVYDILEVLRGENVVSEGDYFTHLLRLREACTHFIPLTSEEVLYHLRTAPTRDGRVQETRGLQAIRRFLAETALREELFELDSSQEAGSDRSDEMPLLQMLWRVPRETLVRLWSKDHISKSAAAYADWIYEALVIDHFTRVPLANEAVVRRRLMATGLAGFIIDGLQISERSSRHVAREAYFTWLDDTILAPHARGDTAIIMEVVETVGDILDGLLRDAENSESREDPERQEQVAMLLADYVRALPERVRDPLSERSDLMQRLPLRIGPTVEFGDNKFDAHTFFDGVAAALRNGKADVRSTRGEGVHLECDPTKSATIRGTGQSSWNLEDPGLEVLSDDINRRRQVLQEHTFWIDRAPQDRTAAIEAIVDLPQPHARMLRLEDERKASAEFQYRTLQQALEHQEQIGPAEFNSITADMVVRHLHIDVTDELGRLELAAGRLLDGLGRKEAIRRMSGLPIRLPKTIHEALRDLAAPEKDSLIRELGARSASPMRQMRAIEWARSAPGFDVTVDSLTDDFFEEIGPRTKLLHEIALWVERSFEVDKSWRDCPTDIRLLTVWCHAERLTDMLLRARVTPDSGASIVAQWTPRDFGPWFMRDPTDDQDPCSPIALTDKSLLWAIVGTALGDGAEETLGEGQRSALVELISHVTDTGARWPEPAVMATSRNPSCLACLFGHDHPVLRKALREDRLAEQLDPAFPEALVDNALSELQTDPSDNRAWTKLLMTRHRGLRAGDTDRLLSILESLDIDRLRVDNADAALAVIVWLCRSPIMMKDTNARSIAEELVLTLTRTFGEQRGGEIMSSNLGTTVDPLATLGDAALHLARNSINEENPQQFATILRRASEASTEAATLWRFVMPDISRQLPIEMGKEMWPAILLLRAERDPYKTPIRN